MIDFAMDWVFFIVRTACFLPLLIILVDAIACTNFQKQLMSFWKKLVKPELSRTPEKFTITEHQELHDGVLLITFATHRAGRAINLPCGKHIRLHYNEVDGGQVKRPYTPIRYRDPGSFQILMKCYPDGKMGSYLKKKKAGDQVLISGPVGGMSYLGAGVFKSPKVEIKVSCLCLVAGGTGLTPMFQIVDEVFHNKSDKLKVYLLYAASTEDDIYLQKELSFYNRDDRIHIAYCVSNPEEDFEDRVPNGYTGRISKEVFDDFFWQQLFAEKVEINTVASGYCGPPGFERACKELFVGQGFKAGLDMFRW